MNGLQVNGLQALWMVFEAASVPVRLVMLVLVVLGLAWLSSAVFDAWFWLADRYFLDDLGWRVWRARVRCREFAPGSHVLCRPDGTPAVIEEVLQPRWGGVRCPPAALVRVSLLRGLPRVVLLTDLVAVDAELAAEVAEMLGGQS
jgi:hypothetical protein